MIGQFSRLDNIGAPIVAPTSDHTFIKQVHVLSHSPFLLRRRLQHLGRVGESKLIKIVILFADELPLCDTVHYPFLGVNLTDVELFHFELAA